MPSRSGVALQADSRYSMRMKRTNLVLDEALLLEATRLSGERTYSRAVERALSEFVRRAKAGRILDLAGSGLWEGDLGEMRADRPITPPRRPFRRAAP
ncbi:MAG TPA: type II toxin-antitoxin system VapB family antitoxin [Thermoanaerobaculia bacterium]|nr:type II toxin-antitoxin system VapB family antitoxin [Thermoanaerobaculia bacterium]